MENDLEPDAKIIFQWKNPTEKRQRIINNEAEEYAVEENKEANSDIIIYGRYGPSWQANPWSARALVKQLLSRLATAEGALEEIKELSDMYLPLIGTDKEAPWVRTMATINAWAEQAKE